MTCENYGRLFSDATIKSNTTQISGEIITKWLRGDNKANSDSDV